MTLTVNLQYSWIYLIPITHARPPRTRTCTVNADLLPYQKSVIDAATFVCPALKEGARLCESSEDGKRTDTLTLSWWLYNHHTVAVCFTSLISKNCLVFEREAQFTIYNLATGLFSCPRPTRGSEEVFSLKKWTLFFFHIFFCPGGDKSCLARTARRGRSWTYAGLMTSSEAFSSWNDSVLDGLPGRMKNPKARPTTVGYSNPVEHPKL